MRSDCRIFIYSGEDLTTKNIVWNFIFNKIDDKNKCKNRTEIMMPWTDLLILIFLTSENPVSALLRISEYALCSWKPYLNLKIVPLH